MTTVRESMRVLMDAHMVGQGETGNETYVLNLLRAWATFAEAGVELWGALGDHGEAEPDWAHRAVRLHARSDVGRLACTLPAAARQWRVALLHLTYHAPFWSALPYVVTVHDTSFRTHPRYHTPRNVVLQNVLGALSLWRARAVITVSEFCRAEIMRLYPFVRDRIFVTLEAASPFWYPRSEHYVRETCAALGVRTPYFLWVGKVQPRKNVLGVVEAFMRVRQAHPEARLVLVGEHNTPTGAWLKRRFAAAIRAGQIVLTGRLSDEWLARLYSGCTAFVFPSFYEGFGLPVLEAMQCGAPVITSNVTALPEVAGDAALLVDPTDIDAIAHAIRRVLAEPELQATLRARGFKRAAQFSWTQTARLTAEVYRSAFGGHAR